LTGARKLQVEKFSEAEAIERAKQGDAEAFEALYHQHKRRVYSLCLRMTANTAAAEDLTQEAFLQLFRKIGTFRGESAFSTWLHRMAVNVVLMQLRKKGLAVVPLEDTFESEEESSRKEPGADDVRLTGSIDRLIICPRVIVQFSCFMMLRGTNTTKLPASWNVRSGIASPSYTKHE
jgi:RNA polymerase sigma factor (sigma-70 family)